MATFSSDIGPKGLTAIAWTVSMPPTRGTSYRARVFAKIRLPGKDRFGPKRFLGIAGPGYVTAAIGGRGQVRVIGAAIPQRPDTRKDHTI